MNILNKIVEKTKERTIKLETKPLIEKAYALNRGNFPFKSALLGGDNIKIIAEIKKASPSKGIICENFNPEQIAQEYKNANVDCISVLTEPYFFMGDNSYIQIAKNASNKPILMKDFIISPAQIYEAKIIGADCILLICAILEEKKLTHYLEIAHSLGLSALVETRCENDIKIALNAGAEIIGVNNRNLETFEVDFNKTLELKKFVPNDIIFVSESGIKTKEDIQTLKNAGVNAVLIGETFMKAQDKTAEIKRLKNEN